MTISLYYVYMIVHKAYETLLSWWIMVYPTETIRWLGWDPTNISTISRLHSLKWSAPTKPLTILVWSYEQFLYYCPKTPSHVLESIRSADQPITHIIPWLWTTSKDLDHCFVSGEWLGIRVVIDHDFLTPLFALWSKPIISTSANFHGENSPIHRGDISPALSAGVEYFVPGERKMSWSPSHIYKWSAKWTYHTIR